MKLFTSIGLLLLVTTGSLGSTVTASPDSQSGEAHTAESRTISPAKENGESGAAAAVTTSPTAIEHNEFATADGPSSTSDYPDTTSIESLSSKTTLTNTTKHTTQSSTSSTASERTETTPSPTTDQGTSSQTQGLGALESLITSVIGRGTLDSSSGSFLSDIEGGLTNFANLFTSSFVSDATSLVSQASSFFDDSTLNDTKTVVSTVAGLSSLFSD